jgi:hypothetical protein
LADSGVKNTLDVGLVVADKVVLVVVLVAVDVRRMDAAVVDDFVASMALGDTTTEGVKPWAMVP